MVLAKPTVVARATKPTAAASSLILRDIIEGLNFCVEGGINLVLEQERK
jgi:hypothetical protein